MQNTEKYILSMLLLGISTFSIYASQEIEMKTVQGHLPKYVAMFPHLSEGFDVLKEAGQDLPTFNNFMDQKLAQVDEDAEVDSGLDFETIFENAIHAAEDIIFDSMKKQFLKNLLHDKNIIQTQNKVFHYVMKYSAGVKDSHGLTNNNEFMKPIVRQWVDFKYKRPSCLGSDAIDYYTYLHHAAYTNEVILAKILVAVGADINIQSNESGLTPLHFTSIFNSDSVAQVLIDAGAHLNIENNDGATPLDCSAIHDSAATAQLLITAGANINHITNSADPCTAAHFAAYCNSAAVAQLLIDAGADLNIPAYQGYTAKKGFNTLTMQALLAYNRAKKIFIKK